MQWFEGLLVGLAVVQLAVLLVLLVRRAAVPPPSPLQEAQRQELLALVKTSSERLERELRSEVTEPTYYTFTDDSGVTQIVDDLENEREIRGPNLPVPVSRPRTIPAGSARAVVVRRVRPTTRSRADGRRPPPRRLARSGSVRHAPHS